MKSLFTKKEPKDRISRRLAKIFGKYLGYYYQRKDGIGPELWRIDVFEVGGVLYGGDEYETPKHLYIMKDDNREEILSILEKDK